jgi:hypothetical protein
MTLYERQGGTGKREMKVSGKRKISGISEVAILHGNGIHGSSLYITIGGDPIGYTSNLALSKNIITIN